MLLQLQHPNSTFFLFLSYHFSVGAGPFPAVIDMFGGVLPGCNEIRAALLASKGYAVLSLEYFWAEGESKLIAVDSLELEYFEVKLKYRLGLRCIHIVNISRPFMLTQYLKSLKQKNRNCIHPKAETAVTVTGGMSWRILKYRDSW